MPCDVSMFEGIELFALLHEEDRQALACVVDTRQVTAGDTLFRAGDPGESLFVVHSGSIELFIKDTAGQKIVLTLVEAGGVFGELSLLDSGPRTATAVAVTDAELVVLDRVLRAHQPEPPGREGPRAVRHRVRGEHQGRARGRAPAREDGSPLRSDGDGFRQARADDDASDVAQ